jgi:hypothetical protein
MAFELGQPAKHCEHQPPMRCSGVAPGIAERLERCASCSDSCEGVKRKFIQKSRDPLFMIEALLKL